MIKIGALILLGCMVMGSIALYRIVIRYLQNRNENLPKYGKIILFIIILAISRYIIVGVLQLFIVICRVLMNVLG